MPFRDVLTPLVSSKTLGYVSSVALMVGLYSCLPMWKENSSFKDIGDMPSQFHAALSLALGSLLVFRTNSAYARWWEARTLWGAMVNATRNLAIKLRSFANLSAEDIEFLSSRLGTFPNDLARHLRKTALPPTRRLTPSAETQLPTIHKPVDRVREVYEWLAQKKKSLHIDGHELRIFDQELAKLLEICGGCERIARTPIVRSYRIFARQCITLFLLTLPWGIASDFGWWTIPLTVITSYFMIGMETVAEHVEEPFGLDEDDLDLDTLCQVIQRSVEEIFAERA